MDRAFDTRKFVRIQSYGCELYSKTIEDEAIACGLTKPEADVLLFFSNNPEFQSAVDVARYRGVSKAYVSKALVRLADKGYITARVDENDRRFQKIFVTDKAQGVVERLKQAQARFSELILGNLSQEDLETMASLLQKLYECVIKVYGENIGKVCDIKD